jgi:hypothetical protein
MEATQFGGRGSANGEPMVISRVDDGFRVYSVTSPGQSYLVSGSAEAPVCTCRSFRMERSAFNADTSRRS